MRSYGASPNRTPQGCTARGLSSLAEDTDCADIGYDPSTKFKNHLLTSCSAFRQSAVYTSAEVLDDRK
jgi:hypothetical protein